LFQAVVKWEFTGGAQGVATGLAPEQPPAGVRLVQHPTMVVDVDRLTDLLAERMAAIVADGFHVEASDGMICTRQTNAGFLGRWGDTTGLGVRT
jgi:hypothetical protein